MRLILKKIPMGFPLSSGRNGLYYNKPKLKLF